MRTMGVGAFCVLSIIAGCHSDNSPTPATAPAAPAMTSRPALRPTPEELTAGMVEGVAQGKSPLLTQIKFELSERPIVGQQLDVVIALIPKVDAASAIMNVSVISDLDLVPGYDHLEIPSVLANDVYRKTVRLIPKQEGVALLGIEVILKHDDLVESKVFSIPLLVVAKEH